MYWRGITRPKLKAWKKRKDRDDKYKAGKVKQGKIEVTDYELYLRSEHWKAKKKEKLSKVPRCQMCQGGHKLNVHHGTYDTLGNERMAHLFVLCRDHHVKLHRAYNKLKNKPSLLKYTKRFIRRELRRRNREYKKRGC